MKRVMPRQHWEQGFSFRVHWTGGPEKGKLVDAESPEDAAARVRRVELLGEDVVVDVGPALPVYSAERPVYDLESAAIYLCCSYSQIGEYQRKGDLPKCREGKPLFFKHQLDALIAKRMGLEQAA
jgi:hypothetical protein